MVAIAPFVLAVTSIFGLAQASAVPSQMEARQSTTTYKTYKGDGTVGQGWPGVSAWKDFETLWNINSAKSAGACRWLKVGENSATENAQLKAAIRKAARDSGLDERFILVSVFQESMGCVRVKTSVSPNAGIRNPGLLQCFNGEHTCNDAGRGIPVLTPCPEKQINGMITDGVGLTTTSGLKQTVERSKASDVSKYYKGALLYNSGVMPASGKMEHGRSNPCYSSDIANRLMGWIADSSPCNRNTIGN